MSKLHISPNYAYIIQISGFASGKVEYYAVEQFIPKLGDRRLVERNREQVRHDLRQVTARQGVVHQIVDEGRIDQVLDRARAANLTLA